MDAERFLKEVCKEYKKVQKAKCNGRIIRGTSPSISAQAEDLLAEYVNTLLENMEVEIWVDPQIICDKASRTTPKGKSKSVLFRPDICVVRNNEVVLVIDIKMDLGYRRGTFLEFAKERKRELADIKKGTAHCSIGEEKSRKKEKREGLRFSTPLKWLYVVVSSENISDSKMKAIKEGFKKSPALGSLYVLYTGSHPANESIDTGKIDREAQEGFEAAVKASANARGVKEL
jgi:hypothetical protein